MSAIVTKLAAVFCSFEQRKKAGVKEPIKQKVKKDEESATLDESGLSLREKSMTRFLYLIPATRFDARSPPTCGSLASPRRPFSVNSRKCFLTPQSIFSRSSSRIFSQRTVRLLVICHESTMRHIPSSKSEGFSKESREASSAKKANKSGPGEAELTERGKRKSCALQAALRMSTDGARVEFDEYDVLRLRASPMTALCATTC